MKESVDFKTERERGEVRVQKKGTPSVYRRKKRDEGRSLSHYPDGLGSVRTGVPTKTRPMSETRPTGLSDRLKESRRDIGLREEQVGRKEE